MEDYSNILWVILVVASLVASVITKRNEKKADAAKQSQDTAPTEWQDDPWNETTEPHEEPIAPHRATEPKETTTSWQQTQADESLRRQPRFQVREAAQSDNMVTQRMDHHCADTVSTHITATYVLDSTPNDIASEAVTLHDDSACARQTDVMADFDLQKAVIWSEILKPKFDEDSH